LIEAFEIQALADVLWQHSCDKCGNAAVFVMNHKDQVKAFYSGRWTTPRGDEPIEKKPVNFF
jgi:ribosomal protein S27AE